ncbi:hypothetical protein HF521_010285 [Silurus meridionalis]|uniref:Uncharacterized protein n=1 Tax=Silurus meridionalis TaxID=175797 RepID=A0A8T0AJ82_SILME|nr:hypothetical protein HF521_010285 [Silurus meridionalis]
MSRAQKQRLWSRMFTTIHEDANRDYRDQNATAPDEAFLLEFHLRYAPLVLKHKHDSEGAVAEARDTSRHPYAGPNLPPDYCLTAPNYKFKSLQKKSSAGRNIVLCFSVGAVASRPSTPTLAILSVQTMGSKVGMPVSLKGQHFTVQITSSQATSTKPATPTTPGMVQNVLINLSLISSKNILITNNMVSQNLSGHSG